MKRRSFLTLLGLSPVVAKAAPSGDKTAINWSDVDVGNVGPVPFARFTPDIAPSEWSRRLREEMMKATNTAPRTREGVRD